MMQTTRLRLVVAIAGGVYLAWWLMVELLLPGSFNPLLGRALRRGRSRATYVPIRSRTTTGISRWVLLAYSS
jgi:hypothetical protein